MRKNTIDCTKYKNNLCHIPYIIIIVNNIHVLYIYIIYIYIYIYTYVITSIVHVHTYNTYIM